MTQPQIIEADLTWIGGEFVPGVKIRIGEDGRIEDVGSLEQPATIQFTGHALLPGMVNAHSHAFQRGLRGSGEYYPAGAGSFWAWRESMYGLVERLDARHFDALCEQAFREMLGAGITTVGEFHYFHHETDEADFAFDRRILDVAARVGIRLTLLNAFYQAGGINQPLTSAQRRFATRTLDAYWTHMSDLDRHLRVETQSLGVVAHSLRAVPIDTVCSLHTEATKRGLPFHMHVEEQRKEIDECRRTYGITPMALLNREVNVNDTFVAVHCTHSNPEDLHEFFGAGGRAVVCPLTEANLGDGIPPPALFEKHEKLSLGTDSNARISMAEEMRWLEYGQRLAHETRGALRNGAGNVAAQLFAIATKGGASALVVNTGDIVPEAYADFVTLDLTHPSLAHVDERTLMPAFVFGSGNEAIADVCVGGKWLGIHDG